MHFIRNQHFIYILTFLHVAAFKATSSESTDTLLEHGQKVLSRCKYQIKE